MLLFLSFTGSVPSLDSVETSEPLDSVLLYGGLNDVAGSLGDVWELDLNPSSRTGPRWRELPTVEGTPPSRFVLLLLYLYEC